MISIINVTKNRLENLEKCWRTWLFADEIIILDYSSDIPIKIEHPKVKVYRYEAKDFSKTKGLNMLIDLTKGDIIIQADSDYYFERTFKESDLKKNCFLTGQDVKKWIDGFLMIKKSDLLKVNGFNEKLKFYAWDDIDLYKRLENMGLENKRIEVNDITHIPHSNTERLKEFGIDGRSDKAIHRSTQANKKISEENPWTINDRRSKYENI